MEAGMVTLEERHRRGDLLQAYRVFNGVDNVDPDIWFNTAQARNGLVTFMNVTTREERLEIRKNFWSQRVIDPWNNLPNQVKEVETFDCFKNDLTTCTSKQLVANERPYLNYYNVIFMLL